MKRNKTLALLAAGRKRYSAASGDAVAFEGDGSPLRGLTVGIEPVQAGSGDPSPDNVRPISGWTGCNVWRTGKNLLPAKLDRAPTEVSGVVWSTNLDGSGLLRSFEATGKPNTNAPFNVNAAYYNNSLLLKAGEHYTLSGCPAGGGSTTYRLYRQSFGIEYYDDGAGVDFPVQDTDSACDIRMAVYKNFQADGLEFHPMIRFSDSPAGYEPYCGDTYTIPFPAKAGTVYGGTLDVLSGVLTVDVYFHAFDGTEALISNGSGASRYFAYVASVENIGDRSTVPYTGYSHLRTRQPTTGNTGPGANVYYSTATTPGETRIAFRFPYDMGLTTQEAMRDYLAAQYAAGTPFQAWFRLKPEYAETYQLTPQQIATLLGENRIWADTGPVSAAYRSLEDAQRSKLAVLLRNRGRDET